MSYARVFVVPQWKRKPF
jgi:hypothetical protein